LTPKMEDEKKSVIPIPIYREKESIGLERTKKYIPKLLNEYKKIKIR